MRLFKLNYKLLLSMCIIYSIDYYTILQTVFRYEKPKEFEETAESCHM